MGSTTSVHVEQEEVDYKDPLKLHRQYLQEKIESNKVVIFSQTTCGYCHLAKELFDEMKIKYTTIELNDESNCPKSDCMSLRRVLMAQTGMRTVPQIFINGKIVGGYTDVHDLAQKGILKQMIEKEKN